MARLSSFSRCDVAELPPGGLRAAPFLRPEREVMAHLFVEVALEFGTMQQKPESSKKLFHTASITRAIAPITWSNSRSSRASCLRPSGVSL